MPPFALCFAARTSRLSLLVVLLDDLGLYPALVFADVRPRSLEETAPMWHLLQISGPLDREFGAALAERVPLTGWEPERVSLPPLRPVSGARSTWQDPRLEVAKVPLLRGFARWPFSALARTGETVSRHLLSAFPQESEAILLCTSPFFAPVAECWPGPVVYWLTDLVARYGYSSFDHVARLDRRLCRVATLVCPNSARIAAYLRDSAACDPAKICLLPNATRAVNLLPAPSHHPGPLPADLADLPRPILGVIGNLATNMDWELMEQIAQRKPDFSWALVGPTDMDIPHAPQREARRRMLALPQVRSVGRKPYGELVHYARCFDVAVLPYRHVEPTYSGSSTRFYEHLAAGRPILATRGFEELLHKRPLLQLFDNADEVEALLTTLQAQNFDDGLAPERWLASQHGTWEERASTLLTALQRIQTTSQRAVPLALHQRTAF